jgi:hypothetical protein
MTASPLSTQVRRTRAEGSSADAVASIVRALREDLAGQPAAVVLYFASSDYEPMDLAGPLTAAFPEASVVGCSTAGEFTDRTTGVHGISAAALPAELVGRHAAGLGEIASSAIEGTDDAVRAVERGLGVSLRSLDPERWFGLVLIDGMNGKEEAVNERLGTAAPLLNVVGGSAGDDLKFERTWVALGTSISWAGVVLLVLEPLVTFEVVKTCSFAPTGNVWRVTKADTEARTVWELDGVPALDRYAEAVGIAPDQVDESSFMEHPVGLMIDGEPFIRSPQQVVGDRGIRFYCQILEGMDVELMSSGDLIGDTAEAIGRARDELAGSSGAVLFNCILRRLEIDAKDLAEPFLHALGDIPCAGFHTYGESWLGHINQTLTGVIFGPQTATSSDD